MTKGFQQQDPNVNFSFPKTTPSAQHGRKSDAKSAEPKRPVRAVEPRPGH